MRSTRSCVAAVLLPTLSYGFVGRIPPPRSALVQMSPTRGLVMARPAAHRSASADMIALDGPLGLASWGLIFGYQTYAKRFTAAWASQNAEARAVWARYILEKGDYILGVQTLRNALTVCCFTPTL